jgi:APA family basic amino acid/polyamine antiporter
MLGSVGALVMSAAIVISTFGCNAGLILAAPRVYYAMARDRLFFARAGELHPTHRTPVFGLITQAVWTSALCLSGTYNQLLDYVIFAALLFYLLTIFALFRLRRIRPDLPRPVRAFGYPVVPGLYALALAALMVVLLIKKPLFTWPGLLIVALGIPVYLIWRRSNSSADARGSA